MNQMSTADEYLRAMSVPAPFDKKCHEFQTYQLADKIDEHAGKGRYRAILDIIFDHPILFPAALPDQGHAFYKGAHYLVAAFYKAGLSREEVTKKLDTLASAVAQEVEYRTNMIKNDPEVKFKRQKLFHSFGVDPGMISPKKRRSRGLSLTGKT